MFALGTVHDKPSLPTLFVALQCLLCSQIKFHFKYEVNFSVLISQIYKIFIYIKLSFAKLYSTNVNQYNSVCVNYKTATDIIHLQFTVIFFQLCSLFILTEP